MKVFPGSKLLFFTLFLAGAQKINAQFYAPDSEYHDPVQRVFVVEAARVLAWWADPSASNIAEVAYSVTSKPDQSTVWDLRWLNSAGKPVKTGSVSYPASVLKAGPDFYRTVFKQLWMADWRSPPALEVREATESFWQGAAKMGLSRETSLERAFQLVNQPANKPDREWIPELAGLLTHASLPGGEAPVTLDRVVQARAAVWLAFCEHLTTRKLDALWAPILFQAYRGRAASELWQSVPKSEKLTAQQQGWDIWLRKPVSKDIFLFAVERTNLPMAMPMLAYDADLNSTGKTLAELIEEIVGSPQQLAGLHNFAPLFATGTSIGGRAHYGRRLGDL